MECKTQPSTGVSRIQRYGERGTKGATKQYPKILRIKRGRIREGLIVPQSVLPFQYTHLPQ